MSPSQPLALVGVGFAIFAAVLLLVPPYLVSRKARTWHGVLGLWIAGCGFLCIALGTYFAHRGWGNLVVFGVVVSGAGHLLQRRNTGGG